MSAMKSNLECIEEEIKVDHSVDSVRNKRSSKRQSINQRYRRSLAFNDKSSSDDDNLESVELNQMWEQLNPSQELADSTNKKSKDSNLMKAKRNTKDKKRIDFDEISCEQILNGTKAKAHEPIEHSEEENNDREDYNDQEQGDHVDEEEMNKSMCCL